MGDHTPKAPQPTQALQQPEPEENRKPDPFRDSITVIGNSFGLLTTRQVTRLDDLKDQIEEEDESVATTIVEGLVEMALGKCGAKCGELVFKRLLGGKERTLEEDFVKKLFEKGVAAGSKKAKSVLRGPKANVKAFISAQKDALTDMNTASMMHFEHVGQYQLKTLADAQQLEQAASADAMEDAAHAAHDIARDLWIGQLARSKFGSITDDTADTRTNMSTQHMRDDANRAAPGFVPAEAPSIAGAVFGHALGVLEVRAQLPEIRENEMRGTPSVGISLLNGVNGTIRSQYEGTPLSEMRIPRQVECIVEGDMPNFTINLDEEGKRYGSFRHGQGAWLEARALVGHFENKDQGAVQREETGLRLLLAELIPKSIDRGLS